MSQTPILMSLCVSHTKFKNIKDFKEPGLKHTNHINFDETLRIFRSQVSNRRKHTNLKNIKDFKEPGLKHANHINFDVIVCMYGT